MNKNEKYFNVYEIDFRSRFHQNLGKVPKEYADAEGLLYRQNDKLLRLIVHQHMQFAQKKYVASNLLVIKRKLIHIRQFAP